MIVTFVVRHVREETEEKLLGRACQTFNPYVRGVNHLPED